MKRREVIELDDGSTKERSVRPLWLFANGNVLRAKWLYHHERTGELAIVTIRMFVAILPVCSLLRAPQLVRGRGRSTASGFFRSALEHLDGGRLENCCRPGSPPGQ
jgi:hypothetical protein